VGAPLEGAAAGAAQVFTRTGSTWTLQATLAQSNTANDDLFGFSVSISGYTVAVAALRTDPERSWIRVSGIFDTGPGLPDFSGGTTLDIGASRSPSRRSSRRAARS
jgi:hypothetical protein